MTQTRFAHIEVDDGVYAPQDDSWLLCDALDKCDVVAGKRVLDICTGSGILAIEAALKGAREVVAYDISPAAVACASSNAERAGVDVDVRLGTLADARYAGPFDVVVSNPPYVPSDAPLEGTGPNRAWDAGANGRVVLDQLCELAPDLLAPGGTMLIVHSEFSDPPETVRRMKEVGFTARPIATRTVDFGPVMASYAERLEAAGLLEPGRREEELVVIRVDRS
ncbi:HemK2/MTQ2 family protein methyltransferase [Dietzia cinnamea]|uniref:HemK2/MTQ2 family protein methyltransferase n=1 Tax=Dietzia cinnamea TaxID=321318 RepID=A0ABV3YG30_9ACTN|nr:HemK2/MTQ2 family protein methyltransferase [Dietzia cinnamea]KZO58720.1 methylase [Dietzia maris]MCT2057033.1 methyltransferase [Dietzia cinnamea]MCT2098067.1 methyltransferase [Dietzia cinnamea]MCT2119783.1 methyltransferase [Dietzia cinnamea]MCT2144214.1 methyltransferase [Dietzia cinnamea]